MPLTSYLNTAYTSCLQPASFYWHIHSIAWQHKQFGAFISRAKLLHIIYTAHNLQTYPSSANIHTATTTSIHQHTRPHYLATTPLRTSTKWRTFASMPSTTVHLMLGLRDIRSQIIKSPPPSASWSRGSHTLQQPQINYSRLKHGFISPSADVVMSVGIH